VVSKIFKSAIKQTMWWKYAAWTLPFVALAIIVIEYFIGNETIRQNTMLVISVTFIATSVFWWWWAINKIRLMLKAMERTENNFYEIKTDLSKTRQTVRLLHDSHRERGEQIERKS